MRLNEREWGGALTLNAAAAQSKAAHIGFCGRLATYLITSQEPVITHTHTHRHTHTLLTHTDIYTHTHTQTNINTHTDTLLTHTDTHTHTHTNKHKHTHIHTHATTGDIIKRAVLLHSSSVFACVVRADQGEETNVLWEELIQ